MENFDELFNKHFSRGEQLPPKDEMTKAEKRWGHEQFAADKAAADRLGMSLKEYREWVGVE